MVNKNLFLFRKLQLSILRLLLMEENSSPAGMYEKKNINTGRNSFTYEQRTGAGSTVSMICIT